MTPQAFACYGGSRNEVLGAPHGIDQRPVAGVPSMRALELGCVVFSFLDEHTEFGWGVGRDPVRQVEKIAVARD